ncbi:UPF0496 protein 4 [Platanthera zijinensis]|uniref:UPF0496 protein 4 n=1 Tax=Platanthera zijinensis TaxID=2320716 RepID=A0AAP0AVI1_9ASPA
MSRTADQRNSPPFGNPFRLIFSRKSHISPKCLPLLNDFELMLARSLRNLKPKDSCEILSLSWMKHAVESLAEIHTNIKGLITDLQFPLTDWDYRWMDVYLNDSIKLLDICIALSSELSQLDQGQLLLRYILHLLDPARDFASELLERAGASLHELILKFEVRNPNLEHCHNILQNLAETPYYIGKAKSSANENVLMRALYGVKVQTIFVCNIIIAALMGFSNPLIQFRVHERFLWSEAFDELCETVHAEIRNRLSGEKMIFFKEREDVELCARRLHALMCSKEEKLSQKCNFFGSPEGGGGREEMMMSARLDGDEERKRLQESVIGLAEGAEKLYDGLEILSNRVDEFFRIVLTGRDALLANLREADART